jgi:hypothetical protein
VVGPVACKCKKKEEEISVIYVYSEHGLASIESTFIDISNIGLSPIRSH